MRSFTRETALKELLIAAGVASSDLSEEDALLWMALLHTHDFHLEKGVLLDQPDTTILPAATEREAAQVIADLWPARGDERARYYYWYHEYQKQPYQVQEDVPAPALERIGEFRGALLRDPRVTDVVEAD